RNNGGDADDLRTAAFVRHDHEMGRSRARTEDEYGTAPPVPLARGLGARPVIADPAAVLHRDAVPKDHLRPTPSLHRARAHEPAPGGRISEVMWRLTSLQKNDFLLGAMIVSLDLNHDTRGSVSGSFWTPAQRADMLSSLEGALAISEAEEASSMEAYKAAKVLRIMVDKLKAQSSEVQDEEMHPEHSAAMTLGMLSSGGVAAPGGGRNQTEYWGVGGGASLSDLPDNLDWAAWDQYVQMGSAVDPALPYFPGVYDPGAPEMQMDPASGAGFGDGVFMGAHTPGRG
ncbi:hypothetical protein V497_04393, partial [Pseudogymnoascus sp. VKM F-4516 (FW-969)]